MIEEIYIKDFALIKELNLKLGSRLNLITGETGAGKSIILGALNMVLGSKATTDLIRSGSERSIVQANFNISHNKRFEMISEILDERGLEYDEGFLNLKREIRVDGKGRSFVNAQQVPAAVLKLIGSHLVEIHGQNEHQQILKIQNHLGILDKYGKLSKEVAELKTFYKQHTELKQKLKSVSLNEQEKNRRLDILNHEIKEIQAANLKDDKELDELISREKTLANAESILNRVYEAYEILSQSEGSVKSLLGKVKTALEEISEYDTRLAEIFEKVQSVFYNVEDIHEILRSYQDSIHINPQELQILRDRLDLVYELQSKYGNTIKEILSYLEASQREYEGIEISSEEEEKIRKNMQLTQEKMIELAKLISNKRREVSKELETKVCSELAELGMSETKLKVSVRWDYSDEGVYIHPEKQDKKYIIHPTGLDIIEFLIAASENNALRPLRKVASGGEMSRIMLAFKKIIIDSDPISTMVFDEVDTGVGGKIAEAVGKKIASLSKDAQVIVITHLHQIAGLSNEGIFHFKVGKDSKEGTRIERLNSSQRIEEIARMLSGEKVDESAIEHAKVLLGQSN